MDGAEGVILADEGLEVVRNRLYDPPDAWIRSAMAGTRPVSLGLALLIHIGCALGFTILLGLEPPEAKDETEIPVEIVTKMPGPSGAATGADQTGPAGPQAGASGPATPPQPQQSAPPPKPEPPADAAKASAEASPTKPAQSPEPPKTATRPREQSKAADQPPLPPLVKPPEAPARAMTQTSENKPADTVTEAPKAEAPSPPPSAPEAPNVLGVPEAASDALPQPGDAKTKTVPKPATPAHDRQADQTAKLAAALPMDMNALPSSFRAVLSGSGTMLNEDYEGLVNGRLSRALDLQEQARGQHLKGVSVVAFSIDDTGQMIDLRIAQSSGSAKIDELAIAMWRRAGPFPPPPPGAPRQYRKALIFGE